jgi:hypothetical protein
MKERVLDVELAYLPVKGQCDGEDDTDLGRFHNRNERLIEVDVGGLREATKNLTSHVALKRSASVDLVVLAGDNVGLGRRVHEVPRVVGYEGNILDLHDVEPIGFPQRHPNRSRGRRSDIMEVEALTRLNDRASATTSHHGVRLRENGQ